jgi:hypothetical protein
MEEINKISEKVSKPNKAETMKENNKDNWINSILEKNINKSIKTKEYASEKKPPLKINNPQFRERFNKVTRSIRKARNIGDAIFVRLIMIVISSFNIYFLACIFKNKHLLIFYVNHFVLILDGMYVLIKRRVSFKFV